MMHRLLLGLVLIVAQWLTAPALAQEPRQPIDIERFKPAATHDAFVITEGSSVRSYLRDDPLYLAIDGQIAANPLVVFEPGGDGVVRRIVERRFGFDFIAAYRLADRFELGLALPIFAGQAGDGDPIPSGLGDLRLVPKVRLVGGDRGGLAILGEVRLPTHTDNQFSGGDRSAIFAPKLALDGRFARAFRVGGNLGMLFRQPTQFRNVRSASELTYSAGGTYTFGGHEGDVDLGVDVHGGVGLAALQIEEAPLEGQLFARWRIRDDLAIQGGPATGLVPGFGTPNFRFFVGLTWSRQADPTTTADAECYECPPCPTLGPEGGLVRAIVIDENDEPIRRSSARVDETPAANTGLGIHEVRVTPGRHTLWVRARGYVPQKIDLRVPPGGEVEKTVVLEPIEFVADGDRLEYNGIVYFAFDSARLLRESYDLLDALAQVLNAYPSIKRLSVQGHADARGSEDYNQDLSERRAASVVNYLVEQGIEEDRLESVGYGEQRPVSDRHRENRRVEFVILRGRVPGAKVLNRDDR
ncbi:MAG: OmpA family protein [Myxococcota bacterium]